VKSLSAREVLARVLLPLLVIPLLGLSGRPYAVMESSWQAQRALEAGKPAAAAIHLARVAELTPWRVELWEQAGLYALEGGDPQSAAGYLEKAASLGQLTSSGRVALGDARQQTGDQQDALQDWQAALQAGGPALAIYHRLLDAHLALTDYPQAIADLQAMTALQPGDVRLRYQLGLLLAAREPEAAIPHLVQVADLDPELAPGARALAGQISTALLGEEASFTLLQSGRGLASLGEWELAQEAFRGAIESRPDYAEAWAYLGESIQHGPTGALLREGEAELQKALEIDPDSLAAHTLMALYQQRRARPDLARDHLRTAIALDPGNPVLQAELGSALASLGDLEAAYLAYQQAVALTPSSPAYLQMLAGFSIKYEYRLEEVGLPAARRTVILAPEDPAALDMMSQVLLRLGDPASAERFLLRALQADPGYVPAHLHLGLVYILRGNPARAYEKWTLVRSIAPDTPSAEQAGRLLHNYFP
jgi:tetratricopeptide (TPR) repeat protein